jgi:thiol:disulfide interchange protein DsbA
MKKLITLLVATLILLGISTLPAQSADFVEGQHYAKVDPPQPTSTGDKIEVLEFFWYGCPHCYRLEPYVKRWLASKPANVEFVRMPGIFSPRWMMHARAYYTAEILGVVDKLHDPIFEAIHGERKPLDDQDAIMEMFKQHGVPEEEFKKVFLSFAVDTKMRRASEMAMRYDIDGVPALIVNGKYRTSPSMVGSNAAVFKVVDQLVAMEAQKSP